MSQPFEKMDNQRLIQEAESWTDVQVCDRLQELLDVIHPMLLDENSEYDVRLNCVRVVCERITRWIPVYEAEDSIFFPLLNGVILFLNQVFSLVNSVDDERVMLMSVATNLIENTDILLQHVLRYEGMGPGEIPSLPKVIPKILHRTFDYCIEEQSQASSEIVKESINGLYLRACALLNNFAQLMDRLHVRTALEDELDILVDLCTDLVSFHKVLFASDLKSAMIVWDLFLKLTTKYADTLRLKLDVEAAVVVILEEVVQTFENLEKILKNDKFGSTRDLKRLLIALSFLVKTLAGLTKSYQNFLSSNLELFLDFACFMFMEGNNIYPHIDKNVGQKLKKEIFSEGQAQMLMLSIPDLEEFCSFASSTRTTTEKYLSHLKVMVSIIQCDRIEAASKIKCTEKLFKMMSEAEIELFKSDSYESVEVPGIQVSTIGFYEWTLTMLCRFLSTLPAENFKEIERILFFNLIGESNLVSQFSCDLLCFVSRYGSSELCLSHLIIISDLYSSFNMGEFFSQCFWFERLIGRLFNFLSPKERSLWTEMYNPSENGNIVLWSNLNLKPLEDNEMLNILENTCIEKFNLFLDEAAEDISPIVLTSIIKIFCELIKYNSDCEFNEVVLTVWRKFAEYSYGGSCLLWVSKLFNELAKLTVISLPKLSTIEIQKLVSWLAIVKSASNLEGNPTYLASELITVLNGITDLEWILQTENVDPCLATDIGKLSASLLRIAVEKPELKMQGVKFIQNLSERSSYSGLTRLCFGEDDITANFNFYISELQSFSCGTEDDPEIQLDDSIPSLVSLVNNDSLPEAAIVRRTMSPCKKRVRKGSEASVSNSTSLEQKLQEIDELINEAKALNLSQEEKSRIKKLMERILSKL